jgi:type I restriction modification DNA specificity protein
VIVAPPGWTTTTIREVTRPRDTVDWSAWDRPTFTYVDVGSIDNEYARVVSPKELRIADAPSRARQIIRQGDTLFATVRTYLRNIAYVDASLDGQVCSTAFCVLRPAPGIAPRYLYYFCRSSAFITDVSAKQRGVSYPAVTDRQVLDMPIPVAPTREQEHIVAAIDEQFSRIDAGVAALESAKGRLSSVVKSILFSAVPSKVPSDWSMITVRDAGDVRLGRQRSPKFHRGASMRPYLRVANVFEDRIDSNDVMTMQFDKEEFDQYRLVPGDILLNEGQSPHLLGRPAMYRGEPPNVAFTNSLIRFRAAKGILPDWALLVFRRYLHGNRFMRESQITTNIAHLSAGRFKTVEFPVPPLSDQHRIVGEVQQQLSVIAATATALENQLRRSYALRSSVLRSAFSGKLVAQDPSDEPATAFLAPMATENVNDAEPPPASTRIVRRVSGGLTA